MTDDADAQPGAFAGLRVIAFESRRASEIATLIRRYGGDPTIAPAVRDVPVQDPAAAHDLFRKLESNAVDLVVMMTGVGVRLLLQAAAPDWPANRAAELLQKAVLVARGPKPLAALRELGVRQTITVPEPNTWREILAAIGDEVAGKRIAIIEYGATPPELVARLHERGAGEVTSIPVYRWALPEDQGPLRAAVERIGRRQADVILFTSGVQVEHLFVVAGSERAVLQRGLTAAVVGSIGPVCSQALREHGITADLEPVHPKMGQLVAAAAREATRLLAAKRAGTASA